MPGRLEMRFAGARSAFARSAFSVILLSCFQIQPWSKRQVSNSPLPPHMNGCETGSRIIGVAVCCQVQGLSNESNKGRLTASTTSSDLHINLIHVFGVFLFGFLVPTGQTGGIRSAFSRVGGGVGVQGGGGAVRGGRWEETAGANGRVCPLFKNLNPRVRPNPRSNPTPPSLPHKGSFSFS